MFSRPWYEIIRERNLLNSIIKLNETIRTRGSSDLILVICAGEISWNISMHSCDRRPSNFEGSSNIIIGRFSCRSENSPLENRGDRKSTSWQLVKLSKNFLFPRNKKRRNPSRYTCTTTNESRNPLSRRYVFSDRDFRLRSPRSRRSLTRFQIYRSVKMGAPALRPSVAHPFIPYPLLGGSAANAREGCLQVVVFTHVKCKESRLLHYFT